MSYKKNDSASIKRAPLSKTRHQMIEEQAMKVQVNENGQLISPNTGRAIEPGEKLDKGHQKYFENRYERNFSEKTERTQQQHNAMFTNPGTFQLEPSNENRSGQYECKNENDAMQNLVGYAGAEDKDLAAHMFINPSEGIITYENPETGSSNILCTYGDGDEFSSGTYEQGESNDIQAVSEDSSETSEDNILDADGDVDSDDDAYTE